MKDRHSIHHLSQLTSSVIGGSWSGCIVTALGDVIAGDDLATLTLDWIERLSFLEYQETVGIFARQDEHFVAAMLAVWHKGGIVVPIKEPANGASTSSVLQHCHARAMVDATNCEIEMLPAQRITSPKFRFKTTPRPTGSDLGMIIYTSGSTGTPKGISLTHNNILTSSFSISEYLEIDSAERILCVSPLSFDYGLYQLLLCLDNNCTLVFNGKYKNPLALFKLIIKENISLVPVVPAILVDMSLLIHKYAERLTNLRKITSTGGHLPSHAIEKVQSLLPDVSIYAMYGLTECKRALYLHPDKTAEKIGSVGKPIPGIEAKIFRQQPVNTTDVVYQEVDVGETGELFVRGSAVMQEYLHNAEASQAVLVEGAYRDDLWLSTGDLFTADEEGFLFYQGRSKELVKQGAFCIYPSDIENLVNEHPEVTQSVVLRRENERGLEYAHLVVETSIPDDEVHAIVKGWLLERCDADYIPRAITGIRTMPLTDNGKLDRTHERMVLDA